jgi:hypothetical protein
MKSAFLLITFLSYSIFFWQAESNKAIVQAKLNNGSTVKKLLTSGIPVDSLYGKYYQGGYIFYISSKDSSGMVMGTKDLGYDYDTLKKRIIWSCRVIHTGATSPKIGDGPANTKKIVEAACPLYDPDHKKWMLSAAEICTKYRGGGYNDWFLPSKNELHEACKKLSMSGLYNFGGYEYWSSTEVDTVFAWLEHFRYGPQEFELFGQSGYRKFYRERVRPVRIFRQ